MESETLVYRRATLADKLNVLNINTNVYNGKDYVPYLYEEIIQNGVGYLCEDKGLVVGFFFITMHDGGETVVMRGGRVRESHKSRGILRNLFRKMTDDLRKSDSNVKFVTFSITLNDANKGFLQKGQIQLAISVYSGKLSRKPRIPDSTTSINVHHIDQARMSAIFNNKTTCDYLFPSGLIHMFTIAYKPIQSNLHHLVSESTFVVCTSDSRDFHYDLQNNRIRLITTGSYFPCNIGLAYQIDVFGGKPEDYKHHLSRHFQKIEQLGISSDISFLIYIPEYLDPELIKSEMNEISDLVREYENVVYVQPLNQFRSTL